MRFGVIHGGCCSFVAVGGEGRWMFVNMCFFYVLSDLSCTVFARCLMASMCVGFLLSSVAAKRTLGSG